MIEDYDASMDYLELIILCNVSIYLHDSCMRELEFMDETELEDECIFDNEMEFIDGIFNENE